MFIMRDHYNFFFFSFSLHVIYVKFGVSRYYSKRCQFFLTSRAITYLSHKMLNIRRNVIFFSPPFNI